MKKIGIFITFGLSFLWGSAIDATAAASGAAASGAADHSSEFEAARLQKATFENRGTAPVTFDVISQLVDFVATGTTKVVEPLPGFQFQGTDAPRIAVKNYSQGAVHVPLKRTLTLNPGEQAETEVPFPHFISGVLGAQSVAWDVSDALSVVLNSGEDRSPIDTRFVTTPKDVAQQLRYYKKYFMADRDCTEAEIIADFLSQPSGVTTTKRAEEVIITLTSYPARFATTWLAIESLLRQDERPDRVNLNLFEGEFPGRVLPWFIKQQMKRGLEINWCPENLKVYLKVIPTVQKFPNAAVVATDDDVIYPHNRLQLLYSKHQEKINDIICYDARIITKSGNTIKHNSEWVLTGIDISENLEAIDSVDHIVGEGVAGMLFPPHIFTPILFNASLFSILCPNEDDIWFYVNTLLSGKRISKTKRDSLYRSPTIDGTQENCLFIQNKENNFFSSYLQTVILFDYFDYFKERGLRSPFVPLPLNDVELANKRWIEQNIQFPSYKYAKAHFKNALKFPHPIDHFVKSLPTGLLLNAENYSSFINLDRQEPYTIYYEDCHLNPFSKLLYSEISGKFNVRPGGLWDAFCETQQTKRTVVFAQQFPFFDMTAKNPAEMHQMRNQYCALISQFQQAGGIYLLHWNDIMRPEATYPDLEIIKNQAIHDAADVVHAFNQETFQILSAAYRTDANKFLFSRHGHYIGYYPDTISREQARKLFNISEEQIIFGCFSNIRRYKQVERIVNVAEQTLQDPQIKFLFSGTHNGSELDTYYLPLKRRIQQCLNIQFHEGFCPDDKLQEFYKAVDFVIFTQHSKMLSSGSVMLALSFGIPVIVPDLPAFHFLRDSQSAFFYDPEVEGALLSCVQTTKALLAGEKNRMRSSAQSFARELTWERCAKPIETKLTQLIQEKGSAVQEALPISLNLTLPFQSTAALRFLKGYSWPEKDGIWSDGNESILSVFVPYNNIRYSLSFEVLPFVSTKSPRIAIKVFDHSSTLLHQCAMVTNERYQLTFDAISVNQKLLLRFVYEGASSPYQLNISQDTRLLGIKFRDILVQHQV